MNLELIRLGVEDVKQLLLWGIESENRKGV